MFRNKIVYVKVLFFALCFLAFNSAMSFGQEVVGVKKAVMIIARENFRDEELFDPKQILEKNGIQVKIASTDLGQAKGTFGAVIKPDILVKDIVVRDFDAVVFIGGSGASQYWDDQTAHSLAQEAFAANRIIGAICIAPVTLAKSGVLKGRRATVWPAEAGQLSRFGANYIDSPVEKDGNIITASGPAYAKRFGEELLKALLY